MSRSQSHISKRLRLLELPEEARAAVDAGRISVGDAVELVKLAEQPQRVAEVLKAAKQGRDVGYEPAPIEQTKLHSSKPGPDDGEEELEVQGGDLEDDGDVDDDIAGGAP